VEELNPISRLIQIQQAKKEKEPEYTLVEERNSSKRRQFAVMVTVGELFCTGYGPNKKMAKRSAAEGLLKLLNCGSPEAKEQQIKKEKTRKVSEIFWDSLCCMAVGYVVNLHHLLGEVPGRGLCRV
jgi:hypothetical protein